MTRHGITCWLGVAIVICLSGTAFGYPGRSGDCASCHGIAEDALDLTNTNGLIDPAGGIGLLEYYEGLPGGSVALTADITGVGSDPYNAVLVDEFMNSDLPMTQGVGSSWTFDDSAPEHFYDAGTSGDSSSSFDLAIPAGTPMGYYPFTYTIGGGPGYDGWHDSESFYVRVVPEPGTLMLLVTGFGAIGFVTHRRRKRAA